MRFFRKAFLPYYYDAIFTQLFWIFYIFNQQNLSSVQGLCPAKESQGNEIKSLLWVQILLLQFLSPQILLFQQLCVEVKQVLFGPGLFSFFQFMCTNFLVKITTYSILKTKEHKLHLADTMAVKVQLQLQFWKCGCDEFAISGPYKLSEAGNECCDMFPF